MSNTQQVLSTKFTTGNEYLSRVDYSIKKSQESGRSFLIILVQLANIQAFRNQRPTHVVTALFREILYATRKAVHASQYVGLFHEGIGLVFEGVDVGRADVLARKLVMIVQHVIQSGKYNDLSSRWTDIIYQFLWPNKPGILYPTAGWSTFPRDGGTSRELVKRAMAHVAELRR